MTSPACGGLNHFGIHQSYILLLLVPTCVLILVYGWHYVAVSWAIGEGSPEAGGLPGLFLLKESYPPRGRITVKVVPFPSSLFT